MRNTELALCWLIPILVTAIAFLAAKAIMKPSEKIAEIKTECVVTVHTTRDYRLTYLAAEGCSPRYVIKEN